MIAAHDSFPKADGFREMAAFGRRFGFGALCFQSSLGAEKAATMPTNSNPELEQLRAYKREIDAMDDVALEQAASGWGAGTALHRVCMAEITRRAKKTDRRIAWAAIWISVASLIVSIVALALPRLK